MAPFLLQFRGELAALVAALIWAGSITVFSRFARQIPALSLNFFKNSIAIACFCAALILMQEPLPPWHNGAFWSLVASGILGLTLGDTLFFMALMRCGAQVATSIQCLGPVFAALIALFVRNEKLLPLQWVGVVTTVCAIALVVQGQALQNRSVVSTLFKPSAMLSGSLLAIVSALVNGMGIVVAYTGFQHFSVMQGTTIRLTSATLGLVLLIVIRQEKTFHFIRQLPSKQIGYLAAAAFSGTFLGLVLLSFGITYAKAGVASALSSSYPIWIVPLSWFVLKERSHVLSLIGTVIAVLGMLCLFIG